MTDDERPTFRVIKGGGQGADAVAGTNEMRSAIICET